MNEDLTNRILELYEKQNSPKMIVETLRSEGFEITIGKVQYTTRKAGIVRKRTEDMKRLNRFSSKNCLFCSNKFLPKGSKQKFCKSCVPSKQAIARVTAFGINQSDYDQMWSDQKGTCAVCNRSLLELRPNQIYIDHDHRTKHVRGIICARCNTFLMVLDAPDSESWLEKARYYLTKEGIKPYWIRHV